MSVTHTNLSSAAGGDRRARSRADQPVGGALHQPITGPTETHTILFEWPLTGLKQLFDSTKADSKSKVVKSLPFGDGRWTVLFYAQSGHDQYCSLYLNAEPLRAERLHPLLAPQSSARADGAPEPVPTALPSEDSWSREGLFRFTFNVLTPDRSTTLGTKEAHDHAFSHKTSNWGWAQFAKRDTVFYSNASVKAADSFLITVTITASAEKPRNVKPDGLTVPPVLINAVGSLLDDPEHSDIVFHLKPSRNARGRRTSQPVKKIYAIKKMLAARSQYFRDMFEGGFVEAELSDDEDSLEGDQSPRTGALGSSEPSHDHGEDGQAHGRHMTSRGSSGKLSLREGHSSVTSDHTDEGIDHEPLLDDSDAEFDDEGHEVDVRTGSPDSTLDDQAMTSMEDSADIAIAEAERGFPGDGQDESSSALVVPPEDSSERRSGRLRNSEMGFAIDLTGEQDSDVVRGSGRSALQTVSSQMHSPAGIQKLQPRGSKRSGPIEPSTIGFSASQNRRKRRKVVVRDSSYPTFKALLFFLYTDTIVFAPLTSSFLDPGTSEELSMDYPMTGSSSVDFSEEILKAHRRRQAVIDVYCQAHPRKPSPCSAKAMYRLADKLQIPDLKRRAQEHIANSLSVSNIVWEAFSSFTSHFPDVRKMEIEFLLRHWTSVKRTTAMKSIFARSQAHPGLAEVWPHLLSQLDYRQSAGEDDENDGPVIFTAES